MLSILLITSVMVLFIFLASTRNRFTCLLGLHVWGNIHCPLCGKRDDIMAGAFEEVFKSLPDDHQQFILNKFGYDQYCEELAEKLIDKRVKESMTH